MKKIKIFRERQETLKDQIVDLLPRLRRFALSLAKDLDRADDLVQAACERALNRLEQLRESNRLDSWLYRIIYTQWIDKVRRQQIRSEKLIILSQDFKSKLDQTDPDSHFGTMLDVRHAFDSLSEEHQAAVMLVCIEGYSYTEAAGVLDVPPGTVASRVARARSIMNHRLQHQRGQVLQLKKMEANNDSAVR